MARYPHPAILARVVDYDEAAGRLYGDPEVDSPLLLQVGLALARLRRDGRPVSAAAVAELLRVDEAAVWRVLAADVPLEGCGGGVLVRHLPWVPWEALYGGVVEGWSRPSEPVARPRLTVVHGGA